MKKLTIILALALIVLSGCGATYTLTEVRVAFNNFANDIGAETNEMETTTHQNIMEYDLEATIDEDAQETIKFDFHYYQLDENTSTSGFFDLIEDEYTSVLNKAICNGKDSSIVIYKKAVSYDEEGIYLTSEVVELTETEQEELLGFANELGCKLTYITQEYTDGDILITKNTVN